MSWLADDRITGTSSHRPLCQLSLSSHGFSIHCFPALFRTVELNLIPESHCHCIWYMTFPVSFLPMLEALYSLALLSDATEGSSLFPLIPMLPCPGHIAPFLPTASFSTAFSVSVWCQQHCPPQLSSQVFNLPLKIARTLMTPNPRVTHRKLTFPHNQPRQNARPKPGQDTVKLQESNSFMGRAHGLCAQIATAITWTLSLFCSLTLSLSFPKLLALSLSVSLFLSVHLLYSLIFSFSTSFLCLLIL